MFVIEYLKKFNIKCYNGIAYCPVCDNRLLYYEENYMEILKCEVCYFRIEFYKEKVGEKNCKGNCPG